MIRILIRCRLQLPVHVPIYLYVWCVGELTVNVEQRPAATAAAAAAAAAEEEEEEESQFAQVEAEKAQMKN